MNRTLSLIGAPTDIGAGSRGASMGPEALRVANIALGGGRVNVSVHDGDVKVEGLPSGIELVTEPRNPLTASADE